MADEMATTTTSPTEDAPVVPEVIPMKQPTDPAYQCTRCGSYAVNYYGDHCFTCGASAATAVGKTFRGTVPPPDSPPTS